MSKESFNKNLDQSSTETYISKESKYSYVARQIGFWVSLFVLTQLVASVVFVSAVSILGGGSVVEFESSVLLQFGMLLCIYLTTAFVCWLVVRNQKFSFSDLGLNFRKIPTSLVYALLIYILYFVVFVAINYIISNYVSAVDTNQSQKLGFPEPKGYEFGLIFVILTIFPSLIEEFIFRGMIFAKIRKVINWKIAAILTSIVFGLLHLEFFSGSSLNWIAAIDTGVFSLFLCYAYQKTNTLWTPIILHFIKNSLAFVVLFVIKYNTGI